MAFGHQATHGKTIIGAKSRLHIKHPLVFFQYMPGPVRHNRVELITSLLEDIQGYVTQAGLAEKGRCLLTLLTTKPSL